MKAQSCTSCRFYPQTISNVSIFVACNNRYWMFSESIAESHISWAGRRVEKRSPGFCPLLIIQFINAAEVEPGLHFRNEPFCGIRKWSQSFTPTRWGYLEMSQLLRIVFLRVVDFQNFYCWSIGTCCNCELMTRLKSLRVKRGQFSIQWPVYTSCRGS